MTTRTYQPWIIALAVLAASGAGPEPIAFHIGGNAVSPSDWTLDQLQTRLAAEIKPVENSSRGAKHTFSCVPLVSLLKAAGVETDFVMKPGGDPNVKNPQLRQAVVVTGRDGYTVVFSLGEILPAVGRRRVWVALEEDGQPLSDADGPVRLLVPDDKMPARGVHQIESIDVVDLGAPTTQP
jgi:hypothetical protein